MTPLLLTLVVAVQPAEPVQPTERPQASIEETLDLGQVSHRAQVGDVVYLALERGGVAVVDVAEEVPILLRVLAEGRAISRILVDGDRLHLIALKEELISYDIRTPKSPIAGLTTPVSPEPVARPDPAPITQAPVVPEPQPEPKPTPVGKIVEVKGGRVIFDGGRDAGFAKGARVRVVSQRLVEKPGLDGEEPRMVASGEVTAVVEIEEITKTRAMARLGRGDVAEAGDLVEPTNAELSERLFLPGRGPVTARFGFHARPFLGLNNQDRKPVGALIDLYGTYYLDFLPAAVSLEVAPAGFVLFGAEAHYPIVVAGNVSYVTDYFEIGLGVGALVGNVGPCFQQFSEPEPPDFEPTPTGEVVCEENTGVTINQMLRLGPIDGLHVSWSSSIFSRPDQFVFGVGRGEVGVPLTSALSLFGAGGAGENGWAFGELGVRSFFNGTGAPGTVVLTASLGVVAILDGPGKAPEFQSEAVVGPSVAFGMEWRL